MRKLSIHQLAGVLAPYNQQGYLSNEKMHNAISETLAEKVNLDKLYFCRDDFGYTQWQNSLFKDLTLEQLSD
ncbi:MAG: hypothetical protein Q4D05_03335 [Acinetobacter sp.]|nr:hypothetical protein [Acinetobacter sp.]